MSVKISSPMATTSPGTPSSAVATASISAKLHVASAIRSPPSSPCSPTLSTSISISDSTSRSTPRPSISPWKHWPSTHSPTSFCSQTTACRSVWRPRGRRTSPTRQSCPSEFVSCPLLRHLREHLFTSTGDRATTGTGRRVASRDPQQSLAICVALRSRSARKRVGHAHQLHDASHPVHHSSRSQHSSATDDRPECHVDEQRCPSSHLQSALSRCALHESFRHRLDAHRDAAADHRPRLSVRVSVRHIATNEQLVSAD